MKKNVIYVDFIFKKKKIGYLNYCVIDKILSVYKYIRKIIPASSIVDIPIKKVQ